jgi:hypothetical protein
MVSYDRAISIYRMYELSLYALFKHYSTKDVKYAKTQKKVMTDFSFEKILQNTLETDQELMIAFKYKLCKFGYNIDEIFEFEEMIQDKKENWDSQLLSLKFQIKP